VSRCGNQPANNAAIRWHAARLPVDVSPFGDAGWMAILRGDENEAAKDLF